MDLARQQRATRARGYVRWLKRAAGCANNKSSRINCLKKDRIPEKLTADQVQSLRTKISHLERLAKALRSFDPPIEIPDTLLGDLNRTVAGQQESAVLASLAIHEVVESVPQREDYQDLVRLLEQLQDLLQLIIAPSYDKPAQSRLLEAEPCMFWIFYGHCRSRNCHDKHEMPDLDKLLDMGIKRVPRWWLKEKVGQKGRYCIPWVIDGTCHSYTRDCENIHAMPDEAILRSLGIKQVPNWLIEKHRRVTDSSSAQEYCNFWIMNGYCAFSAHSCCYRHEMPDEKKLADIGIKATPRWWLERNVTANTGSIPAKQSPQ
ncbi:hypothetical protein AC578_6233 [Pseudocercospora eumusae]|uniref:C3H1-type domain-containing protein n=1 Tax=Pseudocercospora eumusae TaxID=321146 RepID=A0A139H3E8_9PEZI|nr:hypothetical protein AC578_6233 [Pseudocercospora eumusae]